MPAAVMPERHDGEAEAASADAGGGRRTDGALPEGTGLSDGRYRLGAPLGRGGFGITYLADDLRLHRPVAVKELFPEGARRDGPSVLVAGPSAEGFARARTRFLREASTLARFGHPGIVRIFAVLEENNTAYLVLERLAGRTLAAELAERRGPFTEAEALDVAGQVGAALTVVHRAGVLHRDVSPSNLVHTDDRRIVLIDFGLAQPFSDDTASMTRIVTPGYAPPEQYVGAGRFSARADVYALGATLYRLLSGRTPATPTERVAGDPLTPLWRLNPTVSASVSASVDAALQLDPADRPASVLALLEALGLASDELDHGVNLTAAAAAAAAADVDGDADGEAATIVEPRPPRDPVDAAADQRAVRTAVPAPPRAPTARPSPAPAPAPASAPTPAPASMGRPIPAPVPAPTRALAERAAVVPQAIDPHPSPPDRARGPALAPPGRRWVTVPLGLAVVALASAQPATVVLVAGLVVAPVLATLGDRAVRPHRGVGWIGPWWLRNLLVGALRSVVPVLLAAFGLGLWFGADAFDSLSAVGPWVLRISGMVSGWVMAASIGRGGTAFRSHIALDALTQRLMPRGRLTVAAAVVVLVSGAVAAAGFWFDPEAWPLRR